MSIKRYRGRTTVPSLVSEYKGYGVEISKNIPLAPGDQVKPRTGAEDAESEEQEENPTAEDCIPRISA